ncbi:hypothetical protein QMA61_35110 [Streptomyces coelicoflavus]|uniref:hypothetical protein n=1 Tax=Streptomyces coelicoflavus TaxID=285562 RepID=UPI0024AD18EF|nr:hypothetical protein [Streptomyces coelicoflavus]MDI6521414.1 hypothetical protein [Streptomyces coelicoflavus]
MKLADGREVPVVAALVLKLDPEAVAGFTCDRRTTWVGSLHTDTEDDLWDAGPGLLTLPDGRAGTFMTTSGSPELGTLDFGRGELRAVGGGGLRTSR